ncbi:MAG: FYDLN acid domain-containing protein [Nitrospinae bacterium]|nr:FYDLN acid domain-containing protein [Nitrospinota bacterium]
MVKAEWGTRYICFKCSARFYDLKKPTPLCPKCGADQTKAPVKSHTSAPRPRTRSLVPDELEADERVVEGDLGELGEIGLDEIEVEEEEEET